MVFENDKDFLKAVQIRDCINEAVLNVVQNNFPREFNLELKKANIRKAKFKEVSK